MMKGRRYAGGMLLLSLLLKGAATANEVPKVVWHRDAQTASKATRERGRPLLVFVTKDDCYYCTQMKDRTSTDATVAGTINRSFVPLVLDGSSNSPLLK